MSFSFNRCKLAIQIAGIIIPRPVNIFLKIVNGKQLFCRQWSKTLGGIQKLHQHCKGWIFYDVDFMASTFYDVMKKYTFKIMVEIVLPFLSIKSMIRVSFKSRFQNASCERGVFQISSFLKALLSFTAKIYFLCKNIINLLNQKMIQVIWVFCCTNL